MRFGRESDAERRFSFAEDKDAAGSALSLVKPKRKTHAATGGVVLRFLTAKPLVGRQALALAHGDGVVAVVLGDDDAVGVVDDAVADSVC